MTTADGQLLIYDIEQSIVKPRVALTVSTKKAGESDPAVVFCSAQNSKRSRFVATGDSHGVVKVWSLSAALCNPWPSTALVLP